MDSYFLLKFGIFAMYWLAYSLLVLFAIKVQNKDFSFGWVMAGGAFAAASDIFVPNVGRVMSVAVIMYSFWRATHCDFMPDAVFSALIVWIVMFCVHLWLVDEYMKRHPDAELSEVPLLATATARDQVEITNPTGVREKTGKPKEIVYKNFTLKGVSINSGAKTALVHSGVTVYAVTEGEIRMVRIPKGIVDGNQVAVFCESINKDMVTLKVGPSKSTVRLGLGGSRAK